MKTLKNRSLKYQLTSVVFLLSTLPLLLLSVFSMYYIRRTDLYHKHRRTKEITEHVSTILEKDIVKHKNKLNEFHLNILENQYNDFNVYENDIKMLMYQYLMGNKDEINMFLVKQDGSYVGTADLPKHYELPKFSNWGLLRNLKLTNDVLFYPNYDNLNDSFYKSFSLGKKISINKQEEAFLVLDFSTKYIQSLANSVKDLGDGYVQFIITAGNDRIIYNDSSFYSPIYFLDNVFRYERNDDEKKKTEAIKLEEMIQENTRIESFDITIYGLVSNVSDTSQIKSLLLGIAILIVITSFISIVMGFALTNTITKPIYKLLDSIKEYRPFKKLPDNEEQTYENEIQELNHEYRKLIKRIEKYRVEDYQQQELLRMSEIKALMAQINPHFLNNTLDTIKWKAKLQGLEDIVDITTQLSVLLKASMNPKTLISIKEELDFVKNYALLQENRYQDRFNFDMKYEESLMDYEIPKLILQPLVENAIIHGVEKCSYPVEVKVRIYKEDEKLMITVEDNGPGFDFHDGFKEESIGLTNIENRLKLHYYGNASLEITSGIGKGTKASIKINVSKEVNDDKSISSRR